VKLVDNRELRKRTKSFKVSSKGCSSMSVMMNEDSSYFNNALVRDSKAREFRELTCVVMRSTHLIKSLPEVGMLQLEAKKITLGRHSSSPGNGVNQQSKSHIFKFNLIVLL
jgi:hypothetical protein